MNKQIDTKTFYLLKANLIKHYICNTNLGVLECNIRKNEDEYFFTLDSVPVSKEINKELKKLYNI